MDTKKHATKTQARSSKPTARTRRATKPKPVADSVEAKRQELRRLERRLVEVNKDWRLYSGLRDEMREQLREASKLVKAEPDYIAQIVAASLKLLHHFPDALSAELSIFSHRDDGRHVAFCQIPIPVPSVTPTVDEVKATVRKYAEGAHPAWERASVGVYLGEKEHADTERSELLLIDRHPEAAAKTGS